MNKISDVSKGEHVALFNNIAIETSSLCNRHCHFCPNDYFKRPDELMDDHTFYKIVGELKTLKYKGRVEFYIYNEPTKDKRLVKLISLTRSWLPSACLMFSTNGDYIKGPEDITKYFDAGLNQLLVNIYSANDGSDNEKAFQNGVNRSQQRYDLISGWMKETGITNKYPVYQNIGPYKKTLHIANKFGIRKDSQAGDGNEFMSLTNRSGNVGGFKESLKEPLEKPCTRPFRFLNINWNGEALLCCNDYYGKTKMGNVKEKTLVEIWNGEKFNKYRLKLQNRKRNMFLCDQCDFNGGYYTHMINKVTFGAAKDKEILNFKGV